MTQVAQEQDVYLATFEQLEKKLTDSTPSWLRSVRQGAMNRFGELGFPTTRLEEWRFTNVAPLTKIAFKSADYDPKAVPAQTLRQSCFGEWDCHQLVFVNGRFSPELSWLKALPKGVQVHSLEMALRNEPGQLEPHLARYADFQQQTFVALNTAFIADGVFVHVPKDTVMETPIHLLFVSTPGEHPTVSHPRNLIVAEANSQVRIVESYTGVDSSVYFTNAVTEIRVGDNAVVDHYKIQRESINAFHIATLQACQGRSSNFSTHSISLGGALVRNDVNVVLDGEGCECALNGSYIIQGQQHVDNHTLIDHAKPHGTSRELYKGILNDRARGVFNGRIIVRPDAQKTDARQTNKNLLLSEEALVNTNPQLEIYADDVKCTHGATIGQLDADSLFYLRSRGVGLEEARQLLTYAFASDVIGRIKLDAIRTGLECLLFTSMPHGHKILEEL